MVMVSLSTPSLSRGAMSHSRSVDTEGQRAWRACAVGVFHKVVRGDGTSRGSLPLMKYLYHLMCFLRRGRSHVGLHPGPPLFKTVSVHEVPKSEPPASGPCPEAAPFLKHFFWPGKHTCVHTHAHVHTHVHCTHSTPRTWTLRPQPGTCTNQLSAPGSSLDNRHKAATRSPSDRCNQE